MINSCHTKKESIIPEVVIHMYIEEYVNNRKNDIRLYEPPPPYELQDSLRHKGRMKPDSIIANLKPLKVYVNLEVKYDSVFIVYKKPKIGYDFIKKIKPNKKKIILKESLFDKKQGVVLEFSMSKAFFKKHKKIQYDEGYGGFVSFRNLYYSEDGKKAIFEIDYYKRRLNSSSSIIYAEKQSDGTWEFQSESLSVS